jgi:hypothetical protein
MPFRVDSRRPMPMLALAPISNCSLEVVSIRPSPVSLPLCGPPRPGVSSKRWPRCSRPRGECPLLTLEQAGSRLPVARDHWALRGPFCWRGSFHRCAPADAESLVVGARVARWCWRLQPELGNRTDRYQSVQGPALLGRRSANGAVHTLDPDVLLSSRRDRGLVEVPRLAKSIGGARCISCQSWPDAGSRCLKRTSSQARAPCHGSVADRSSSAHDHSRGMDDRADPQLDPAILSYYNRRP